MTEQSTTAVVSRQAAQAQASRVLNALDEARPGAVASLADDTVDELRTWDDIAVRSVPATQSDAGCSVAGAYLANLTPPVLAIANEDSLPRRAFTALHELAHHLQQTKFSLMAALLQQPDGGHALEDAACDAFAADILLPTRMVEQHLAAGVTAPGVAALWRASSASRAAACVRAYQQLTTPGHVILLDAVGDVQFAAANRLPPVRRGSSQAHIPVVREAMRIPLRGSHGRTQLAYRNDILGQYLFAQTANMGGYVILVAVTDHTAWETTFHLPAPDDGPQGRDWTCEQCGHDFATFARPCTRCHAPTCPACARCNCTARVTEKECERCHMVLPARMFIGDSARCTDCA